MNILDSDKKWHVKNNHPLNKEEVDPKHYYTINPKDIDTFCLTYQNIVTYNNNNHKRNF